MHQFHLLLLILYSFGSPSTGLDVPKADKKVYLQGMPDLSKEQFEKDFQKHLDLAPIKLPDIVTGLVYLKHASKVNTTGGDATIAKHMTPILPVMMQLSDRATILLKPNAKDLAKFIYQYKEQK